MPTFRHIRTRVMVVLLLLLAVVLGAVLFAAYRASLVNARSQAEAQFDTAGRVFTRLQAQRAVLLRQGAEMLAGDAVFRQALRDADPDAMGAALSAQARRLGTDMAMLISVDGRVLVNTRLPGAFGSPFPCPRMIQVAEEKGGSLGYARIGDLAYQLVLVPVMVPKRVAWLALGFPVSDGTAREFRDLTGVALHFLSVGDAGAHVLASSLEGPLRQEAVAWLTGFRGDDYRMRLVRLGGAEYWAGFVKQESASAVDYVAALTLPAGEALVSYKRLRGDLLLISALALLAFLYGASFLAKRLTLPLQDLAAALRRVGRGHYDTRVTLKNRDELGALADGLNRMAGELSARERQIAYLAYHDALTGLPNRASFVTHVNEGKRRPGVMLVACLARLREVGVSLGQGVADGLVQAVAQRIQGRDDWQVASLGDERFAFFCPLAGGLTRDDWEVRVRAVLDVPVEWQGQRYDLGLHLGSALCPEDGTDAETLLRRAEQAMRHGIRAAGTHVAWRPEFESDGVHRLALLNDLRDGIEAGQLLACYQPKARLSDGRVTACELLVRWRRPAHGQVFPDAFIPAVAQSTLIRPLTGWVIDTAAAQAAQWRAAGREMAVSVNLSARNLEDHEVVEQIANALARHDLPPSALAVEITEGALMDDPETAAGVVNAIAALGVKLSIDDFGAGYSSLAQLARLPVHELKIDRAFVARMLDLGQDAAIVKSTIDLAHTLGLVVVAEGVESAEQWQRLVAYGCDEAQGYYLTRPLEAADLEAWLVEQEA